MREKFSLKVLFIMILISVLVVSTFIVLSQNRQLKHKISKIENRNNEWTLLNIDSEKKIKSLEDIILEDKLIINEQENKIITQKQSIENLSIKTRIAECGKPLRSTLVMTPKECEKYVGDISMRIIEILERGEYSSLAEFIHPRSGLRFSPYTYIDLDMDLVLSSSEYETAIEADSSFLWGYEEGTGKDIVLSISEYIKSYLYPVKYYEKAEIAYSEPVHGSMYNGNHYSLYFNPAVVEFFYQDLNSEIAGVDYKSLKLIFEEYENEWYLINVASNYWTP